MRPRPRIADAESADRLESAGAVLLEGPKSCGKTANAQRVAATVFRMDTDDSARDLVHTAPELLVSAPHPVLFDEWQVAPKLWNLVRRQVDDLGGEPGRFLFTGSATPRVEAWDARSRFAGSAPAHGMPVTTTRSRQR